VADLNRSAKSWRAMKATLVPLMFGLFGCALFLAREKVGRFAYKIGFPPFQPGAERERVRLFGVIGVVFALISFGMVGLMLIPSK
jgi:hypothetical protein